jgi:hypothetical protein
VSLWISTRYTVTLHHILTGYYAMFEYIDDIMGALAKHMTAWKKTTMPLWGLRTRSCQNVTMKLLNCRIFFAFRCTFLIVIDFCNHLVGWTKKCLIIVLNQTSHTIEFQGFFVKYVKNEYGANCWCLWIIKFKTIPSNNSCSSAMPQDLLNHPRMNTICPAVIKYT